MATHYEVLGVDRGATDAEVRRAYRDRARVLHPDRTGGDAASERAMQDLNEAWRVLRDPGRRAEYDRRLAGVAGGGPSAGGAPHRMGWDDDYGQVYGTSRRAEPGDVAASIVRALPWVGVLFVLAVIFVFTAFAAGGGDEEEPVAVVDLLGRCVEVQREVGVVPADCDQPNEGRVTAIGRRASHCPSGATVLPLEGDEIWLCLRPADEP